MTRMLCTLRVRNSMFEFGGSWGRVGRSLVPSWAVLGRFWAVLGWFSSQSHHVFGSLEAVSGCLGAIQGSLGIVICLGNFERSGDSFGQSLGDVRLHLGVALELFSGPLELCF